MINNARSIVTVNVLVLAMLAIGLLNNVVIAAVFGLTRRVDAFFAAAMLPSLVMVLCVDYLGKNFLPVLALAKQESDQSAAGMTSSIVTIVATFALIASALLAVFAGPVFSRAATGFRRRRDRAREPLLPDHGAGDRADGHQHLPRIRVAVRRALRADYGDQDGVAGRESRRDRVARAVARRVLPAGRLPVRTLRLVRAAARPAHRYRYSPTLRMRAHLERRVFTNSAVVMSTGLIARTKSIFMNYLASHLGSGAISALALASSSRSRSSAALHGFAC